MMFLSLVWVSMLYSSCFVNIVTLLSCIVFRTVSTVRSLGVTIYELCALQADNQERGMNYFIIYYVFIVLCWIRNFPGFSLGIFLETEHKNTADRK